MRCQCPHYRETPNGWRCTERLRLEEQVAALKDALRREKARNRHQDRTGTEAEFGASAPSSHRVKANSPEEKRKRRGGARKGHAPHVRRSATEESADEVLTVAAPGTCPCCGGQLEPMGERHRTADDLERLRPRRVLYRLERKWCPACGHAVQAKPPGILPRAGLTNRALAVLSEAVYADLLPAGTASRMTGIGKGRLLGAMAVLARRLEACLPRLRESLRSAVVAHSDETPWRCDGLNGYAWGFLTADTSLYAFRTTRASSVAREHLEGIRPDATVVTDRYGGYRWLTACHRQFCFEHLKRDALDIARQFPKSPECRRFSDRAAGLLRRAMRLRREAPDPDDYRPKAFLLAAEIEECMASEARHRAIQAFQDIFRENRAACMRWTAGPHIPAENNAAERAMRPLAVVRKISGGSQSEEGLRTREVLASVWTTLRLRHGRDRAHALFVDALDSLAANPSSILPDLLSPPPANP